MKNFCKSVILTLTLTTLAAKPAYATSTEISLEERNKLIQSQQDRLKKLDIFIEQKMQPIKYKILANDTHTSHEKQTIIDSFIKKIEHYSPKKSQAENQRLKWYDPASNYLKEQAIIKIQDHATNWKEHLVAPQELEATSVLKPTFLNQQDQINNGKISALLAGDVLEGIFKEGDTVWLVKSGQATVSAKVTLARGIKMMSEGPTNSIGYHINPLLLEGIRAQDLEGTLWLIKKK